MKIEHGHSQHHYPPGFQRRTQLGFELELAVLEEQSQSSPDSI
jgi:hypothetical protein